MKKILLYCLPLCLLFASCSDLLDEESYSETGKDNYPSIQYSVSI